MEFQVFFRTSQSFGKDPIMGMSAKLTLKSLLKSFTKQEIIIICDNKNDKDYLELSSDFPIVYKTKLGNPGSFRLSIKLTEIHQAKNYYFVEDDHLHLPNQKEWIREGLKYFEFISLYDHPDKYRSQMYKDLKRKIILTPLGYFASSPSTVMTFACKAETLKRTKSIFLDKHFTGKSLVVPKDHYLFGKLNAQGYRLGSPLPGRSTHCEREGLSPFIDWENYIKELKE